MLGGVLGSGILVLNEMDAVILGKEERVLDGLTVVENRDSGILILVRVVDSRGLKFEGVVTVIFLIEYDCSGSISVLRDDDSCAVTLVNRMYDVISMLHILLLSLLISYLELVLSLLLLLLWVLALLLLVMERSRHSGRGCVGADLVGSILYVGDVHGVIMGGVGVVGGKWRC